MDHQAFMIVTCTVDPAAMTDFQHYVGHAQPVFARHGGKRLGQYAVKEAKVGDSGFSHVVVMSFPTRADVDAVFADPSYLELVPYRDRAFPKLDMLITEVFGPQA
jgi:uncharacterized protein (DUF1330 family)